MSLLYSKEWAILVAQEFYLSRSYKRAYSLFLDVFKIDHCNVVALIRRKDSDSQRKWEWVKSCVKYTIKLFSEPSITKINTYLMSQVRDGYLMLDLCGDTYQALRELLDMYAERAVALGLNYYTSVRHILDLDPKNFKNSI